MFLRIDRLQIELTQPKNASPESAATVQERLGGRFGDEYRQPDRIPAEVARPAPEVDNHERGVGTAPSIRRHTAQGTVSPPTQLIPDMRLTTSDQDRSPVVVILTIDQS